MKVYTFSKEHLHSSIAHAEGCELTTTSLSLVGSTYLLSCDQPFPDDQFEHLQSFTDIRLV